MEKNLIHLIFCIDSSGSMYSSVADVLGGYKKTIEEQKAIKDGECIVSLFTFDSMTKEHYIGKSLNDVGELDYRPSGLTALYDAIGTTIDRVGKWYSDKPEDERGGKKLVVIITDGEENASKEYSLARVKEMIKEQETKYSWSFVYLGYDLSNAKDANSLGIKYQGYSIKSKMGNTYDIVNKMSCNYRCAKTLAEANATMDAYACSSLSMLNTEYKNDTGIDIGSINTSNDVDTPSSATYMSLDCSDNRKKKKVNG